MKLYLLVILISATPLDKTKEPSKMTIVYNDLQACLKASARVNELGKAWISTCEEKLK
jgi:hypothetical protein